jgi:hypothetical protein
MTLEASPGRSTSVEAVITRIECQLLGVGKASGEETKEPAWLEPAARRLDKLLSSPGPRAEFKNWLAVAAPYDHSAALSNPVREWLQHEGGQDRIENRWSAAQRLSEALGAHRPLDNITLRLAVTLGLQYVVLQYLPGLREFRGSFLQSNMLPTETVEAVCRSLRVPLNYGAVSWMSSLLLTKKLPDPIVVTLHDAALDLRGRVAAEDLVLGNRSVSGFVVGDAVNKSISGYFFISHPVPGLFVGEAGTRSSFEVALGEIYREYATDLARAIEADLLSTFGSELLRRSSEWNQEKVGASPIMSLSSESPTGFLAALRARPYRNPVTSRESAWALDCQVNEGPFINSIWERLQLTCSFFGEWADRVPRHMQLFAELLRPGLERGDTAGPRLAWVPQYRGGSPEEVAAFKHLHSYFPDGILDDLNRWMSSKGQEGWIAWHQQAMEEARKSSQHLDTPLHAHLNAALSVYSGPEPGYMDLVVPILGTIDGEIEEVKVVGFIRFNCDPGPKGKGERFPSAESELEKFRQLYRIIKLRLPDLDQSVGVLLAWIDALRRRLLQELKSPEGSKTSPIQTYKQATDAARVLTDWVVRYISYIFSNTDHPPFEIVSYVFRHLFELNAKQSSLQGLQEVLEGIPSQFERLRDDLSSSSVSLPEIPVVTFWLQTTQPAIEIIDPPGEGTFKDLAELLELDPSLPQLLSYLSYVQACYGLQIPDTTGLDLLQRQRIVCDQGGNEARFVISGDYLEKFELVFDLGYPPQREGLGHLRVASVETIGIGAVGLTLQWQMDKPEKPEKEVRLKWSLGSQSLDFRPHPFPAAVHAVRGKVSQRVGAVISRDMRVKISNKLLEVPHGQGVIAITEAFEDAEDVFGKSVLLLEEAMLGNLFQEDSRATWRWISTARNSYLFMLVSSVPSTPVISSFRDVALAYEKGSYLAWILGEESFLSRSAAAQLAAVGHGYVGPVGNLRHEMVLAKTLWDSQEALDSVAVSRTMKELINQAGAIIRLGGAAIDFARMDVDVLESEVLGGRSILDQIRLVIAAYQSRDEGIIRVVFGEETKLSTFKAFIVPSIFIHGFSKILDNAVKAAKAPLTSGGKDARVEVSALLDQSGLTVKIKNSGVPLNDEVFGEVQRALLNGDVDVFKGDQLRPSLGLHEAWRCFRKLGARVAVDRLDSPFVVEVAILLRPYR